MTVKHIRVLLLSGATITATSTPGERIDLFALIRSMPQFQNKLRFSFKERADIIAGYMMQPKDIVEAAKEIRQAVREDGADGVVVVMGTDCMEEGSFGFELLLQDVDAPVVVTGGMCTSDMYSADGPANLFDAVSAAASDALRGVGVVVVTNGWIHSAQYVQKLHPTGRFAFQSEFPLGMVIEGYASLRNRPVRRKMPWLNVKSTEPKNVLLQYCYLGVDGKVFDHIEEDGYDGIVVAGTGCCDIVPAIFDKLEALRKKYGDKLPIVIGTRTGKGESPISTYGDFEGSPSYIYKNYLMTGQLDCPKARILLTLLLMSECTPEQIRESFHMYFRSEN